MRSPLTDLAKMADAVTTTSDSILVLEQMTRPRRNADGATTVAGVSVFGECFAVGYSRGQPAWTTNTSAFRYGVWAATREGLREGDPPVLSLRRAEGRRASLTNEVQRRAKRVRCNAGLGLVAPTDSCCEREPDRDEAEYNEGYRHSHGDVAVTKQKCGQAVKNEN